MPSDRFRDRKAAGQRLAAVLSEHDYEHPIVLGIPRGGMVVAAEVAKALAAELGIIVAKKLQAPYQSELSLGAVTADDFAYVDAALAEEVGASSHYLLGEQHRQAKQAERLRSELNGSPSYRVMGRDVLVVTDGLTTGASAIAAVRSIMAVGATRVIAATPVAPQDAIEKLRQEATEVVCLLAAPGFLAVAQFYDDFRPISNDDVRDLLQSPSATSFS